MAFSPLENLPMPHPTLPRQSLSHYKILSFDIYGTLIDFKPAIYASLQPLLSRLPDSSPWRQPDSDDMQSSTGAKLLQMFKELEDEYLVGKPVRDFRGVLNDIYLDIAVRIGLSLNDEMGLKEEAERFGASVGQLPAFADTVRSLRRLEGWGHKLVYLSNIERTASELTARGPLKDVKFWREYAADDFEQDSPDRRKLEFLVTRVQRDAESEGTSVDRGEILHVANSLGHDHGPAKELGLSTVWIVRDAVRWGKEGEIKASLDKVGYGWRFNGLEEFADAVEKEREGGN